MEEKDNLMSNITKDLKLGKKKNDSSKDIPSHSENQKFVYIDKSRLEENENNIPLTGTSLAIESSKVSFSDVLKNFNLPSMLNETTQTKLKKTLKNFVKNKDKSKVDIKFDDTEGKVIERTKNYESLVKDVTKYQAKVKINREADVLDFTTNHQPQSFTVRTLINNSSAKDLNDLEKTIKDVLTKNKYDTEDKIIEEENKKLMNVNPEELKRRHEELKKIKGMLFQQELKNKRKSKIKSKLYHKIKKRQREKEERMLLEQLEEVDPDAVKTYMDKKKLARIQERIELKHSFNSKFNKTVKRYNLHKDDNVKEAIKENFKLRDELMKKIKGNEEVDDEVQEDEDEDEDEEIDLDNEEIDEDANNDQDDNENDNNLEEEEEIEEDKLLLNFNEEEVEEDQDNQNASNQPKGVWAMKFMKNAENMQSKLKEVLNEIDSEEEFNIPSEDDEEDFNKNKKNKKQRIETSEESQIVNVKSKIVNSRRKNVLDEEEEMENKKKKNFTNNKSNKITSDVLNDLNEDAKKYLKDDDVKVDLNGEDIKKLVQMEEINEDEEMFNKFLVQNDENKTEFLESAKPKVQNNSTILAGWGSWAGDSKAIQAKEFLKKKRLQEIEKRKQSVSSANTSTNNYVKVNNSFDKKFSNYMVKELPNNIRSQEDFEKLNGTAFGREWNSLTMYKKLIQPNIVKKIGQIIEPMRINDNTSAKKICEIIEKATKKKQRTKAKI